MAKNKQCEREGHKFDEFHLYEVVCSRCRICRSYTAEDEVNLRKKYPEQFAK